MNQRYLINLIETVDFGESTRVNTSMEWEDLVDAGIHDVAKCLDSPRCESAAATSGLTPAATDGSGVLRKLVQKHFPARRSWSLQSISFTSWRWMSTGRWQTSNLQSTWSLLMGWSMMAFGFLMKLSTIWRRYGMQKMKYLLPTGRHSPKKRKNKICLIWKAGRTRLSSTIYGPATTSRCLKLCLSSKLSTGEWTDSRSSWWVPGSHPFHLDEGASQTSVLWQGGR